MLPPFGEFESDGLGGETSSTGSDDGAAANAFDQATYGLWSTIMENPAITAGIEQIPDEAVSAAADIVTQRQTLLLHPERRERLEEFSSAFLAMSVFDIADFWVPSMSSTDNSPNLHHVFSLSSDENNSSLNYFKSASRSTIIKGWSGAVGRAFCSGNPVWSADMVSVLGLYAICAS